MILVLRALKLGDLLVAVPALRAIRGHWPSQRVVLAAPEWLRQLVELTGCADELLPTPGLVPLSRRAYRPDVAINLHGAGPQSNILLDNLRPAHRIGHAGHGWRGPRWVEEMDERARWCRMLAAAGLRTDPADLYLRRPPVDSPAPGAVVIHPGAAYGSRHWPLDRYAEVARAFGGKVVITGSEAERPLARKLAEMSSLDPAVVLTTSLRELAALVSQASLVISADTGIAHLTYAYRTPSVVLFGPLGPQRWGPPAGGPHIALTRADLRRGEPFADDPDPALLGVTTDEVLAAAWQLMEVKTHARQG
ncbi:glycosyltransferase family 9 protein [Kibdelosporangium persicum]|uniref:Lipopolysaccharide core heptosyltransferase rfaQ n=1 Tax=Kibdelosporangium persicum TaxID=2698649 RepID=A0ABX2F9H1_9PSEU|nr:glycosyltransferase family 9 protein [Kibdelosporangium persicum]NRN67561.1 Lipopolysaccharide core heptosyltransferase rfaQ [Kibdelosporangium persicum]